MYMNTYGIKNITTLYFTASIIFSLKSDINARVIPHPGQGNPKNSRKTQVMSK